MTSVRPLPLLLGALPGPSAHFGVGQARGAALGEKLNAGLDTVKRMAAWMP